MTYSMSSTSSVSKIRPSSNLFILLHSFTPHRFYPQAVSQFAKFYEGQFYFSQFQPLFCQFQFSLFPLSQIYFTRSSFSVSLQEALMNDQYLVSFITSNYSLYPQFSSSQFFSRPLTVPVQSIPSQSSPIQPLSIMTFISIPPPPPPPIQTRSFIHYSPTPQCGSFPLATSISKPIFIHPLILKKKTKMKMTLSVFQFVSFVVSQFNSSFSLIVKLDFIVFGAWLLLRVFRS